MERKKKRLEKNLNLLGRAGPFEKVSGCDSSKPGWTKRDDHQCNEVGNVEKKSWGKSWRGWKNKCLQCL